MQKEIVDISLLPTAVPASSRLTILCDFDGTISLTDTADALLSELADPSWEEIEQLWLDGKIGSAECMSRQIPLLKGSWTAISKVLDSLEIDPFFKSFVDWCNQRNFQITVVSDGMDRVIRYFLQRHNIVVDNIIANRLIEDSQGSFQLLPADRARTPGCQSGVCKCLVAQQVSSLTTKVIIGDSKSDFCWAKEGDVLFAKKKLLQFCQQEQIPHFAYSNFADIIKELNNQDTRLSATIYRDGSLPAREIQQTSLP